MKRLLFIGYDLHLKTKSDVFFIEILRRRFDVTTCYLKEDGFFCEGSSFDVLERIFDVLVCWQVRPPVHLLKRLHYSSAAFFPMADACPSLSKPEKWFPFRNFQIICFSRVLSQRLLSAGFSSRYVQYFPKPNASVESGDPDSAFLWMRRGEINPERVFRLFEKTTLKHLHVHNAMDSGDDSCPTARDNGGVTMSMSKWFPDHAEMIRELAKHALYIAPRVKEGIGHSFLEAMALGRCVVAPDAETMNEYIEHGQTGFLYDTRKSELPSVIDVRTIQRQTLEFMRDGHEKWVQDQDNILKWIVSPAEPVRWRIILRMILRFFSNPIKVLRVLREA